MHPIEWPSMPCMMDMPEMPMGLSILIAQANINMTREVNRPGYI